MSGTPDRIQFTADRGDSRLRLDRVLLRRVVDVSRLSRALVQRWIAAGAVSVDAVPATRPAARVREGAAVDVVLPLDTIRRARPEAEEGALAILYEDEDLIVVDKPPGLVVHPSYKRSSGTLLNAVLWHTRGRAVQPGILTRLDKDTSGLVVIALRPEVHAAMQRDADAGRISKAYLTVVAGRPLPAQGTIALALARDPDDRRRVVAAVGGAPSETRYDVLRPLRDDTCSLVRCELVTGRTHQIRVHMAASGWPVLGDPTYGVPDAAIARQALHAWRVSLPHPVLRHTLDLEAPIPHDMRQLTGPTI